MTDKTVYDELSEPLRRAVIELVAEPVSQASEERILTAARALAEDPTSPVAWSSERNWSRRTLGLLAFISATLLLVVFWPRDRTAWAEIIESIAQKKWIQVSVTGLDQPNKTWYSVDHGIIACSSEEVFVLVDFENHNIDTFALNGPHGPALEAGKIYRTALTEDNRSRIDFAKRSFEAMLTGNELGIPGGDVEILSHRKRDVVQSGQKLIEHHFTTKSGGDDTRRDVTLLVDAKTALPISLKQSEIDGTEVVLVVTYPETGPKNIYDLGAPRTAEVVDTRPHDDVQRVLDGLRKSRTEMDAYCIVATEGSKREPLSDGATVYRIWKRQTKWRIEKVRTRGPTDGIPEDTDPLQWWHEHVTNADTSIEAISDGNRECTYKPVVGTEMDPNNPGFRLIKSYEKKFMRFMSPKDPGSQHRTLIPEFVGYPRCSSTDLVLEPNPKDGPENTIRLERNSRENKVRYWLDPNRGYLVMRAEHLQLRGSEYAVSGSSDTLEVVQSPSGKWLPTLIRKNAGSLLFPQEALKSLPIEQIKNGLFMTDKSYLRYFIRFDDSFSDDLFVIDDQ